MTLVPGYDVEQRPHRYGMVTRHSDPRESIGVQALREVDRRRANDLELLQEVNQRAIRKVRVVDVRILVETCELGCILTGKAKRAIDEDSLGVADVADHLLGGPLAWRVRIIGLRGR